MLIEYYIKRTHIGFDKQILRANVRTLSSNRLGHRLREISIFSSHQIRSRSNKVTKGIIYFDSPSPLTYGGNWLKKNSIREGDRVEINSYGIKVA